MYHIYFFPKAKKQFKSLSKKDKAIIKKGIDDNLKENPYPEGNNIKTKIGIANLADYRLKAKNFGRYRILYDIHKKKKIVAILKFRIRNEKTYK